MIIAIGEPKVIRFINFPICGLLEQHNDNLKQLIVDYKIVRK